MFSFGAAIRSRNALKSPGLDAFGALLLGFPSPVVCSGRIARPLADQMSAGVDQTICAAILCVLALGEKSFHFVGRLAHHGRHDVTVDIHRHGDRAVSEEFHDRTRMDALREQQRGGAVPQIMESKGGRKRRR